MTTRNEAAERLHFLFSLQPGNPKQPHDDLDDALAAAKAEGAREVLERIRDRQTFYLDPRNRTGLSGYQALSQALFDEERGGRESSLGRDAEGHLVLTLGPGAESPSRKGDQTWQELDGLSPLEQWNREGNR